MKLQFAYTPSDKDVALQVKDKLQSLGYELTLLEDKPVDEEGVKRIVNAAQPELIIHTAAMSDIPTCENDPEGSY